MAEFRGDQAAGLRRLFGREQLRVVSFAAGCEGVGKSVAVANLAAALARQGKEVLILDENTGADNQAALFGVPARYDLVHVVNREKPLEEVLLAAGAGVRLLPAARAVKKLSRFSLAQKQALVEGLAEMEHPADVILVDTAVDHPLGFSPLGLAAQETVIVLSATGSAITEAYALIKKMSTGYARRDFRILVNKVKAAADAEAIFDNIAQVASQRLHVSLDYSGCIPLDDALRQSSRLAQPVVTAFPESPAARSLRGLAADMLHWPQSGREGGGLEQFVQQLLHLSQRITPSPIHAG
ncbi:MinD/ParA family ATP-binding protein [Azospira oryzae]|uniref:MinD/ParA family ATP-binding protein n=1 Tax=Azospira oryzae TaxID=146939 RepID=UPI001F05A465|nr:AAA family ATPase [Azospira oryzae]